MRALLVEDDDDIAGDVARALSSAGYLVERAADGEKAWFLGDTEDFAVVVLDLGLPVLDGLSVLKRWRAAERRMKIFDAPCGSCSPPTQARWRYSSPKACMGQTRWKHRHSSSG
mgnify:CR=1 FL=1